MPLVSLDLWFSDAFRGYRKRPVAWNGLFREDYSQSKLVRDTLYDIIECFSWFIFPGNSRTVRKGSKYGVFSSPYFAVFELKAEVYSAVPKWIGKWSVKTQNTSAYCSAPDRQRRGLVKGVDRNWWILKCIWNWIWSQIFTILYKDSFLEVLFKAVDWTWYY